MRFWDEYKPTRPHQWNGSVADVRTARFDGMAAFSEPPYTARAGALAGAIVTVLLRFFPLSPVRHSTFWPSIVLLSLYGALLALWRQRGILVGRRHRLFKRDLLPHSLFTYVFIPFLPIIYMCILPDMSDDVSAGLDTFTGGGIMLLLMFWTGALFDYLWETFHNYSLILLSRSDPDRVGELTLRMWVAHEEKYHEFRLDSVTYQEGNVVVEGWFENPADLQRKLLLLDFVKEAKVEQQDERP